MESKVALMAALLDDGETDVSITVERALDIEKRVHERVGEVLRARRRD